MGSLFRRAIEVFGFELTPTSAYGRMSYSQFGRVIAEAMACGVPVVGSNSGGIPEVIDSAGLIVPENDASALAEALHTAIFDVNLRARFIQRGKQRVENELSIEVFAQKLLDFYNRIL